MTQSQEQERRLRQTTARRTTSNSNKVKQHILEQRLNDKGGDGEKKTSCLNMEMDTTKLWNWTQRH